MCVVVSSVCRFRFGLISHSIDHSLISRPYISFSLSHSWLQKWRHHYVTFSLLPFTQRANKRTTHPTTILQILKLCLPFSTHTHIHTASSQRYRETGSATPQSFTAAMKTSTMNKSRLPGKPTTSEARKDQRSSPSQGNRTSYPVNMNTGI